ncbi:MAG: hypothetical protein Q4F88_06180, partial [Eubacteriales bacterium]|nr:hypothetical protein [Eubacteriales bacterium]
MQILLKIFIILLTIIIFILLFIILLLFNKIKYELFFYKSNRKIYCRISISYLFNIIKIDSIFYKKLYTNFKIFFKSKFSSYDLLLILNKFLSRDINQIKDDYEKEIYNDIIHICKEYNINDYLNNLQNKENNFISLSDDNTKKNTSNDSTIEEELFTNTSPILLNDYKQNEKKYFNIIENNTFEDNTN